MTLHRLNRSSSVRECSSAVLCFSTRLETVLSLSFRETCMALTRVILRARSVMTVQEDEHENNQNLQNVPILTSSSYFYSLI